MIGQPFVFSLLPNGQPTRVTAAATETQSHLSQPEIPRSYPESLQRLWRIV
jgi:hypothetical protein